MHTENLETEKLLKARLYPCGSQEVLRSLLQESLIFKPNLDFFFYTY